jgi:hypothetical protein
MKLSGNRLQMSDGSIRHFESSGARDRFERAAKFFKAHPLKARKVYGKKS